MCSPAKFEHIIVNNNHQVRGELSQFVDDLVVTEQLISTILETPVSEQLFLEQLQVMCSWLNGPL